MKKLLTVILFVTAIICTGCDNGKKVANLNDLKISFEYREVADNKFEFRNTSTPEFARADFWFRFEGKVISVRESENWYPCYGTGTYNMVMQYKPEAEIPLDSIYTSKEFTMTITGIPDSVWRAAVPVE